MKKKNKEQQGSFFERASNKVTLATGSTGAIVIAFAIVLIWAFTGPLFHYSETWQLVINTGTTIITFLMVFLIQKSQNKESLAVQLKLNELIAANELASNRLVDVEDISEEELQVLRKYYVRLSQLAKKESDIHATHSIDEAATNHSHKTKNRSERKPVPKKNN